MATAGYDPRAALDLWDLMAAVEADAAADGAPVSIEDSLSFLHTHPTSQVRQQVSPGLPGRPEELMQMGIYRRWRSICRVR
jgi:predicted Zn-dependent protease